ncbi:hypothetical protein OAU36_00960 [Gammaproteobacteria bacterium]|nr:hypothetical protein [Gammaproteobacteria bacterium]MDC3196287.1 hypothetical protein [Gammaproteobacteria bacterium]
MSHGDALHPVPLPPEANKGGNDSTPDEKRQSHDGIQAGELKVLLSIDAESLDEYG